MSVHMYYEAMHISTERVCVHVCAPHVLTGACVGDPTIWFEDRFRVPALEAVAKLSTCQCDQDKLFLESVIAGGSIFEQRHDGLQGNTVRHGEPRAIRLQPLDAENQIQVDLQL